MAKIKYDVKGVDPKLDRKLPKPGVYRCKITSCVDAKPSGKDRRLEVQYEITEGDNKGFVLYDYINLDSEAAAWKLAQFVAAVGLGPKGTLDPEKLVGTALSVRTKLQAETDQWPAKAVPATLMPLDGDEDEDEDEDLDDDDETEDTDDDTDEDEDDEDSDDDDDDDEDEEWTEEELEALDKDELKDAADEAGVDFPEGKLSAKRKAQIIADILASQEEDDDEDDDEDEDEDDEDESPDYSEMDLDELTEAAEENDLDLAEILGKGKKKLKGAKAKKALIAALEAMDDDDEDEDDESPDYDAMDIKELRKLAKERDLDSKGSKKVLVARLEKDDEPF